MKKLLPYILILVISIGLFSPVRFSLAATCTTPPTCTPPSVVTSDGCSCTYVLLAPLPNPDNSGQPLNTYDPSQNNNIGGYLNLIIKLFIGICAVLAVIMIVVGGIEYMTSELPGLKSEGKDRIVQAILGLLLALGAWTLLYTINPNLLDTSLKTLTSVTVEATVDQPQTAVNGRYADGSKVGDPWGGTSNLPSGVSTNKGECATIGQQNCTSTKGLDPYIINSIKSDCPTCKIVITGGTESWLHSANSSHKPGSSTVDFSATSDLNKEITGSGNFPKDGATYEDKAKGVCYFAEGAGSTDKTTANHWHAYKC
jgi:type IV secretory pathway VirB2 component (pilin)